MCYHWKRRWIPFRRRFAQKTSLEVLGVRCFNTARDFGVKHHFSSTLNLSTECLNGSCGQEMGVMSLSVKRSRLSRVTPQPMILTLHSTSINGDLFLTRIFLSSFQQPSSGPVLFLQVFHFSLCFDFLLQAPALPTSLLL